MRFDTLKLAAVIAAAKAAAANSPRWLRAIEKAAAALIAGELRIHLFGGFALVASKNGVYKIAGAVCECKAAQAGHRECYHIAAMRLVERYEAAPAVESKLSAKRQPTITRSIEPDYNGARVVVVRCNGWMV